MSEILAKHYETVREETLMRMKMRQTVLVLYLGFVGTILGFTVGMDQPNEAAIVIPLVSFGVFWIIRDHELALACLGLWLKTDYEAYLQSNPKLKDYPQWDKSKVHEIYSSNILISRFIGYKLLFAISGITGLIVSLQKLSGQPHVVYIGICSTLRTSVLIVWTYVERRRMKV